MSQPDQHTRPDQLVDLPSGDWFRLDPRMLLVHPVREVIRFLPALVIVAVVVAYVVAARIAPRTDKNPAAEAEPAPAAFGAGFQTFCGT